MKRIRYLTMLMLLLGGSISLWAQDDTFNPVSPGEPGPPGSENGGVPMLTLVADPTDGGTVTGAGWYEAGTKVTLRAYNKTNYVFSCWMNELGEIVSTESQFKYTKLAGDETLTAYFRFSPGNPAEPVEIAQLIHHLLSLQAEEGGSVSGGGKYLPNTRVYLSASMNTGFVFNGWYNDSDELVSSSANFYYTTTAEPVTLTARFRFDPSAPGEPVTPSLDTTPKHILTVSAQEGGTVNTNGSTMKEGSSVTLTATANTGYVFAGWYVGDELYTTLRSFTYTMQTNDIAFVAHFTFNPSAPGDPSEAQAKRFTFTLYNRVCKPGDAIKFPVYLTSTEMLYDMQFQLTFPKDMRPEVVATDISAKAIGYSVSLTEIADPEVLALSSVDENAAVYVLTFMGGTLEAGNTVLLNFTIHVNDQIPTAQGYPVRINQVSLSLANGNQVSAATRNGRISVYKLGDANGDNEVNEVDAQQILDVSAGIIPLDELEVPEVIGVPGGNDDALEVNAQIILDYSVSEDKPW